jgi:uncharacterized membrane protein YeiH
MFSFFLLFDFLGTFVFAVTGGLKAIKYQLDILGVLVLSLITGIGGGIFRDIMLGQTPPNAFRNEIYFIVCIAGAICSILIRNKARPIKNILPIFDAFGLGIFAAAGALKALEFKLGPIGVGITTIITATGGGMVRDVFVREIPAIIRTDIYATAALSGGIVCYFLYQTSLPFIVVLLAGFFTTTTLRLLAMYFHLELPKIK